MKHHQSSDSTESIAAKNASGHTEKILVPIDFSPESVAALRAAVKTASATNADITLLNVVEGRTFYRGNYTPSVHYKMHQAHARQMEHLADEELPASISAHLVVVDGDPAREITRIAEERHMDCIIIATRRHRQNWFRDGTAKKVRESAACKVIVLRNHETAAAIPA